MGPLPESPFGAALRSRRVQQGMTLVQLSALVHYSPALLSRVETGHRAPSALLARRCDEALSAAGDLERLAVRSGNRSGTARPACLPWNPPGFTGRALALARLEGICKDPGGGSAVALITGPPGVGKTSLAVHFAHSVTSQYPDGQLYADLRGFAPAAAPATPGEVIRGLLEALGVPPARMPGSQAALVSLYRTLLNGRRVLLVLDNARDAGQVTPLMPGSPGCLVLVTSRDQLSPLVAGGARLIALDMMTSAEARSLLEERVGRSRAGAEPAAVDRIVARCAGLPLALAVVAARAVTRPAFPLAVLADELDEGLPGPLAAHQELRAVFSWSLSVLSPAAVRLFRLTGLLPTAEVSVTAAASLAGIPPGEARWLLAELASAHLLTELKPGRFGCHDLLRAYARSQAEEHHAASTRAEAAMRLLDHYLHTAFTAMGVINPHRLAALSPAARQVIDPGTPAPGTTIEAIGSPEQAIAWFGTEREALKTLARYAADAALHRHAWQLAWTMWTYLHRQALWHDQAEVHRAGLAAARRLGDPAALGRMCYGLATAHASLGRYRSATRSFEQAARHYRRAGDLIGAARSHAGLALACVDQGNPAEGVHGAIAALAEFESVGHEHGQAEALNLAGWACTRLGRPGEALEYCQRALTIYQRLGDPQGEAHTWDSIGYARHQLGEYGTAISCFERAIGLHQKISKRYREAESLAHLGDTHHAAGHSREADRAWQLALDILTELDHPDAAGIRDKLASSARRRRPTAL